MSVGLEHWPWQWWGRGGLGAADDLWEPEPEGSRENPRELKTIWDGKTEGFASSTTKHPECL